MRIAFLPISPMLFEELAAGAAGEVSDVRTMALRAVEWACESGPVGILTPDQPVNAQSWSLTGFGVTIGDGTPVGLAEAVARRMLDGRRATAVGPGADLSGFGGLLVMGDGSASRSEKAPGHINEAAVPFDDTVLRALADGDAGALAELDLGLAQDVGAAGAPAWSALGDQISSVESSVLDLACDPFGVLYIVARWSAQPAGPA